MKLADMTWEQVASLVEANPTKMLAILPLGSTEQHGQRLPLGTDHFVAEYLASEVARRIPTSILLPTLTYGMSWHHTAFPGTISIAEDIYEIVVGEVLRSIIRTGFRRILIVNAHGGNEKSIGKAIANVKDESPEVSIINPLIRFHKEIFESGGWERKLGEKMVHAGRLELAMLAAVCPEKVKNSSVVTDVPEGAVRGQGTGSPEQWKELFPRGQKGDQREVKRQIGERFISALVDVLTCCAQDMLGIGVA